MVESDFERLKEVIVEIMTRHQSAVSRHGHKKVFSVLKKNPTYGFNKMNINFLFERLEYLTDPAAETPHQPAKLGVMDFIIGMAMTKDFSPLVVMASFFNMACFPIPKIDSCKEDILQLLQKLNKEYAEGVNETLETVQDNKITQDEAKKNVDELMDIINAASSMKIYYENLI